MRYEEFPGPLEGWTYDENGTVYTASGYRCNARHIEAALWLFQCFSGEARRYLIHSDEAPGATRPVYEIADLSGVRPGTDTTPAPHRQTPLRPRRPKTAASTGTRHRHTQAKAQG